MDHLSCQGRDFPVVKGYAIEVEGVPRTVRTVAVPRSLQDEYRVAVRRDGAAAEERLTLEMDGVDAAVQC
ncbi:hypothetical protein AB0D10_03830 [Kitasatospora sp. NPDC048545]|uniref:hypothetical protein n=1 Tax=Kitasatospora sp. NPDC048545 TaxID=3157208 RepID=UPI003403718C